MSLYYADDLVELYLGDCTTNHREWASEGELLLTDPPYGISWSIGTEYGAGHPSDGASTLKGRPHSGIANDENTLVRDTVLDLWGRTKPALVFGSPKIAIPEHTRKVLVWQKTEEAGVVGNVGGWRSDWEAVYVLGKWPGHKAGGNMRSSIVRLKSSTTQEAKNSGHPHAKNVTGLQYLLEFCPPGTVVDPCAGSGSTLVAAKALGRRAIGVEIDERYCEMAARRLAQGALEIDWAS